MKKIAYVSIYTTGRLSYLYGHPVSRDFYITGAKVMRQAAQTGSFIKDFSSDRVPISDDSKGKGYPVITITVWKNVESLYQFTFSEKLIEALRNRSNWMERNRVNHCSYVV